VTRLPALTLVTELPLEVTVSETVVDVCATTAAGRQVNKIDNASADRSFLIEKGIFFLP
jgi:hypothetical protein